MRRITGVRSTQRGFTIVETMIVLAVTGALFVAIATTLTGRQNAAEFTHAIQSVQSQLQQIIDQVPDGFFPDNSVSCTSGGGTPQFTAGVSGSQGSNQPCVFLGKVVQFAVKGTGGNTEQQYQIYTIAGLNNAQGTAAQPFTAAEPAVVQVNKQYAQYSTAVKLEYGLEVSSVKVANNEIGAVGFLMEPGSADSTSSTGYTSGAQAVDLVPILSTSRNQTPDAAVTSIELKNSGGLRDPNLAVNPPGGVQICFTSGTTNQSGLVTIGSIGRQLKVSLAIKNNTSCQ